MPSKRSEDTSDSGNYLIFYGIVIIIFIALILLFAWVFNLKRGIDKYPVRSGPEGPRGHEGRRGEPGTPGSLPTCTTPPAFSVFGATGTSETNVLTGWTEDYDTTDGGFNTGTAAYTVPAGGQGPYVLYSQVTLTSTAVDSTTTESPTLTILVNNIPVSYTSDTVTLTTESPTMTLSLETEASVMLSFGDVVTTTLTGAPDFTLSSASDGTGSQFNGFRVGGCAGTNGTNGCGFSISYTGVVDDSFFTQEDPPWITACDAGCTYFAVVTVDNRTNDSVPANFDGDLTNHLIQYNCGTGDWTDLGQFLTPNATQNGWTDFVSSGPAAALLTVAVGGASSNGMILGRGNNVIDVGLTGSTITDGILGTGFSGTFGNNTILTGIAVTTTIGATAALGSNTMNIVYDLFIANGNSNTYSVVPGIQATTSFTGSLIVGQTAQATSSTSSIPVNSGQRYFVRVSANQPGNESLGVNISVAASAGVSMILAS